MALISVTEAKELLPGLGGTGNDSLLTTLIGRAGVLIARYCGYLATSATAAPSMESAARTLYLPGPGGRELVVPAWPLTAVTSIEDDPTRDFDGASYLVASSDYTIESTTGGRVRLKSTAIHGAWSDTTESGDRVIKIVCTAGYATIPDDLKHAAAKTVKHLYEADRNRQGVASGSNATGSTSYRQESYLPRDVRELLTPFVVSSVWP